MGKNYSGQTSGKGPRGTDDRSAALRTTPAASLFDSLYGTSKSLQEEAWKNSTGKLLQEESWKKEWEIKTMARSTDASLNPTHRIVDRLLERALDTEFAERRMWVETQAQTETIHRHGLILPVRRPSQATPLPPYMNRAEVDAVDAVEALLHEAWTIRELMASLMEQDWLGLQCLAQLRARPYMSAADLGAGVNRTADAISPTLARLERYGAVGTFDGLFVCTKRGLDLLKNLEVAAAIDLNL